MRGRLAHIALVAFLMVSLVAGAGVSTDSSEPVIQVDPKISTAAPGETFTIDVNIANVTMENSNYGVYCWEFDMSFNKSLLEVTSVEEGSWLKSTGEDTLFIPGIHNDEGWVVAMSVLYTYPETGVVGSGTLANVTFNVLVEGKCSLDIYKTILTTYNGTHVLDVDHTIVDGIFTNLHDVAVVDVEPSTTSVVLGNPVSINVTVANEGDFAETFDVITYWEIGMLRDVIETREESLQNGTSKTLSFSWTPNTPGTYTIHANVSVVEHEIDTDDNTFSGGEVEVVSPTGPKAIFTYSPEAPIVGETVTFNATDSYDRSSGGNITSYKWNFGDESVTVEYPVINHTYIAHGKYSVVLTVTDNDGETDTSSSKITVRGYPVAFFEKSPPAAPALKNQPVTFDASLSDPKGGTIANYTWDFGDGNITTIADPIVNYSYTAAGVYTVNLTVTDSEGLTGSFADTLEVLIKHDVAVVSVDTNRGTYDAGTTINIDITVLNNGTETETFNVTVYYDNTIIRTLEVDDLAPLDQPPNNTRQITIKWVTKDVPAGKYTLTAEAILDGDEDPTNNVRTREEGSIELAIFDVAVTNVEVSSNVVLAGDLLNITVVVKNKGTSLALVDLITVWLTNATSTKEGPEPQEAITVESAKEETVLFRDWNATKKGFSPGNYTLSAKAIFEVEPDTMLEDNVFTYGEITLGASFVSISATPRNITLGSSVTINGSITPFRRNVTVTVHYRVSENDTWSVLEIVTTDDNGTYLCDWTPEATGTYEVMASWEGDDKALPSESETLTLIVNPATPILLYALVAVAAAAAIILVAIYFLKIRKPKSA